MISPVELVDFAEMQQEQFALTEASYTTIRLMQEFKDVESRDPQPWIESLMLTATGYNGARVVLTPA